MSEPISGKCPSCDQILAAAGPCEHVRFHRLSETEERVERFVLGLIEDAEALREKVEEQAERERCALKNTDREAKRVRSRLEKLEVMEDGYSEQQAEGLLSMDRLRQKLGAIAEERTSLEEKLAELSDSEERLRELEALPNLIEEYLRELPHLLDLKLVVREYETVRVEPTIVIPVEAETDSAEEPIEIYRVTPEAVRQLSAEELAEKRRAVEEQRSRRFRELYAMLGLQVVCHKDRSLEITWGVDCSKWLSPG